MKHSILIFAFVSFFLSCNKTITETKDSVSGKTIPTGNPEKIVFPSKDGLPITAYLYEKNPQAPTIVLCHQASFNKFEYDDIAPMLRDMGYNCLAIDQRSGGPISSTTNETWQEALKQGKPVEFTDAEQDILAAVEFAAKKYTQPVILWGSSYSSTLALYMGQEQSNIKAVIAFSPGNYLENVKGSLTDKLWDFKKPVFITASKFEKPDIDVLTSKMVLADKQIIFIPTGEGYHGSKALWLTQPGRDEYLSAVTKFLNSLK